MRVFCEAIKKYGQEILHRKIRLIIAAITFVVLSGMSFVFLYEGYIGKRLIIFMGLSFVTALFIVLPKFKNPYLSFAGTILYLVLIPQKMFHRIELPTHDMAQLIDGATEVNLLIIFLIYAVLVLAFQNVGIALGVGGIIIGIATVVNYFVYAFRGMPLRYSDLFSVKATFTVIDAYEFKMSPELWYSILYFLCFIALGFWCGFVWKYKKWFRVVITSVSLCFIVFFFYFWNQTNYLEEKQLKENYCLPSMNQHGEGFLLSFALSIQEMHEEKPIGYSDKVLEGIQHQVENTYEDVYLNTQIQRPNIIAILNESWVNLSVLGEVETNISYMSSLESMEENATKGYLSVSILGGLTANTEFEFLTGNSMTFLPKNAVPYQLQVNHDIYSLASVLGEQGYQTMAIYPGIKTMWNRDEAYSYMGFDEFLDINGFETEYDKVRDYVSDDANYNEIIWQFEHKKENQPLFLFDVTIQNHSGYGGGVDAGVSIEKLGNTPKEAWGDITDIETVVNLMKISDKALHELIEYFEKVEEPTIICVFGAHQPKLGDNVYDAIMSGSGLTVEEFEARKYVTPYMIWANYDMDMPQYGDMSANYLGMALLECAGVELPVYYKMLLQLQMDYPEISYQTIEEIKNEEQIKQYEMLQYNHLIDANSKKELFSIKTDLEADSKEDMHGANQEDTRPWYEKTTTICHAGGVAENGETLTNSLDALKYNYDRGHRVFEIDTQITADNVMVLRHDWASDLGQADDFGWTEENKPVPTLKQFLDAPIYDKYKPTTLLELYEFMAEKEDVYVVLDPKYSNDVEGQFSLIVDTAIENGYEAVLDRVVVQIYYEEMYEKVEQIYSFKNYLYTLYYLGYSNTGKEERFCVENKIPVLVMPYTWINSEICNSVEQSQLKLFVHTVNDIEEAKRQLSMGVDGIYTDEILPRNVKRTSK